MSNKAGVQALKQELGESAKELPALKHLSEADLKTFAAIFGKARKQQRETLNRALEDALGHVPMLLRGTVRKLFFG